MLAPSDACDGHPRVKLADVRRYPVHVRHCSCPPRPHLPSSALPHSDTTVVPHADPGSQAQLHAPPSPARRSSRGLLPWTSPHPTTCGSTTSADLAVPNCLERPVLPHHGPPYLGSARLPTAATSCTPPRSSSSQPAAQPAATASATASHAERANHTPRAKPAGGEGRQRVTGFTFKLVFGAGFVTVLWDTKFIGFWILGVGFWMLGGGCWVPGVGVRCWVATCRAC